MERIDDLETGKKRLQIELDDLVSTRGTADKNVHELEKAKRALESQLTEQKTQVSASEPHGSREEFVFCHFAVMAVLCT